MKKNIAVVLSGCGHKDGAEITEAVSALIALSEAGVTYQVFAPQQDFQVRDPITAQESAEKRSVLKEAARISRGNIKPLNELQSKNFDGIVFPGGMGAALNLSSWGREGAKCKVEPDVERAIKEFYAEQKPIAAICIAPALIAKVLGPKNVTVTIGNDSNTAAEIEKAGAIHEVCAVDDFVTDRDHRVITTPAYMYADAQPFEVFNGIRKAMQEFVEMA
jgi:enhancing lycopene biosynthesis protein 2